MNKTAIKNFAVNARRKLMADVKQKAYELGIEDTDRILSVETIMDGFRVVGRNNAQVFRKQLLNHRERLIKEVEHKGLEQVVEEVAYTWFNRFIALRFMEVNEYLPTGVRVLSSVTPGKTEPDIIQEALNVDLDLNKTRIYELQDAHDAEELYRYLLVKQCNKLSEILPRMFERIDDFTELLLPDHLLKDGSVIRELVESIEDDDFHEQVEIIGWLYQYYISEKKDAVFAALKDNIKITKENIPAATQLFTPKWIVKYMVENSLGKLWLESHPEHSDLKENWKYFIEEAEQEPAVRVQLDAGINKNLNPEEITFLDPAMGSGHILVYAFEVLYEIYLKAGYSDKDISRLILEKNLYGLDIDDRAGQLAYFALMMKARSKNRRIFRAPLAVNVYSIQESNHLDSNIIDILANAKETLLERAVHHEDIYYLMNVFQNAKDYGSILNVQKRDFKAIELRISEVKNNELPMFGDVIDAFIPFIEQAKVMSQQYDVVVTNPPYMGNSGMSTQLSEFVKKHYPDAKYDMSTVFMQVVTEMCKPKGYIAMINIPVWMFLSTYEELRRNLIMSKTVVNMLHFGRGVFGSDFGTTAFVIKNHDTKRYLTKYRKLYFKQGAVDSLEQKEEWFLSGVGEYLAKKEKFNIIPGVPLAYWASDGLLEAYNTGTLLGETANPKQGSTLGNNEKFLRFWHEVVVNDNKWVPCLKGGAYKKWYGNHDYVVNWENAGSEIKASGRATIRNASYLFQEGITWSRVTIGANSFRIMPKGYFVESASGACFPEKDVIKYVLAFLNSKIVKYYSEVLNPSATLQSGDLARIPCLFNDVKDSIDAIVLDCIAIAKLDWDSSETAIDFQTHPLLTYEEKLVNRALDNWTKSSLEAIGRQKQNEELINKLFIGLYGLQNELEYDVNDTDISLNRVDTVKGLKTLISFAVGCMFGRYSLTEKGLIFPGKQFESSRYGNFIPESSNILAIYDDEYFEGDITNRFVEFIKVSFGEETLQANLTFIAEKLDMKTGEIPKDTIRRYFIKDFYVDHVRMYKNRPIYWQFDSGKQNGFKALIYMHRYDENTIARVRTEYLHELQKRYEGKVRMLQAIADDDASAREQVAARKQMEKIAKQQKECLEYDLVIAHVANQRITIDLDDGVKANYALFQNIEVSAGEGKKAVKANLLTPIKL